MREGEKRGAPGVNRENAKKNAATGRTAPIYMLLRRAACGREVRTRTGRLVAHADADNL